MTTVERAEVELSDGPLRVRLAARLLDVRVAAGGPCRVEVSVEVEGGTLYLAVGTDRRTRRPAFVQVSGTVGDVALDDPAGPATGAVDGPAGAVPVTPGTPYAQVVLVNQFVALERTRELVAPGAPEELRLVLSRPLPLATSAAAALTALSAAPVSVEVVAEVSRDDDGVRQAVEEAVATLQARSTAAASNEVEDAVATLVALRLPESRAALAGLADHPNPLVREAAGGG